MKIQAVSDLHLEFYKDPTFTGIIPAPDADVLVLAGDIGVRTSGIERFKGWPVPVIYVYGNHEMYDGNDLGKTVVQLRKPALRWGCTFLKKRHWCCPSIRTYAFWGQPSGQTTCYSVVRNSDSP